MKRLQIYIEPEMDVDLAALAGLERISKAALVRRYVAHCLRESRQPVDPLDALVGRYEDEPSNSDDVVYGR
jgi:hypothetical protein